MGGRNKKPLEQKELEGTVREDRQLENSFSPSELDKPPDPPEGFNHDEVKIWHGVVDELHHGKILKATDLPLVIEMVRSLCLMNSLWDKVRNEPVLTNPNTGNLYTNPAATVYNAAFIRFEKIAGQFGLSPSTRQKIMVAPKEDDNSPINLIDNL